MSSATASGGGTESNVDAAPLVVPDLSGTGASSSSLIPDKSGTTNGAVLLYRHALGEISRLVHIASAFYRNVVRQQLQRNRRDDWL